MDDTLMQCWFLLRNFKGVKFISDKSTLVDASQNSENKPDES